MALPLSTHAHTRITATKPPRSQGELAIATLFCGDTHSGYTYYTMAIHTMVWCSLAPPSMAPLTMAALTMAFTYYGSTHHGSTYCGFHLPWLYLQRLNLLLRKRTRWWRSMLTGLYLLWMHFCVCIRMHADATRWASAATLSGRPHTHSTRCVTSPPAPGALGDGARGYACSWGWGAGAHARCGRAGARGVGSVACVGRRRGGWQRRRRGGGGPR